MQIDITPEDNAQEKIDSSQVGDTITFSGTFHLEEPLTFWNNRDYYGTGSKFYTKKGGIVMQNKPGERESANRLAQWLHNSLYFPAHAEPISYDIDEDTTIIHKGELIVDHGEILSPLPRTPWHFYPQRWMACQLLNAVHFIFWFPRGSIINGFYLNGASQVSPSGVPQGHSAIRIIDLN